MGAFIGCLWLAVAIAFIAQDITRSLDCVSGHAAACELVAKRYQQNAGEG